ncbi:MAG TPA: MarR family winged helix-turn-helix transcriptional regulator [Gemmatimonadaceae bacterium]
MTSKRPTPRSATSPRSAKPDDVAGAVDAFRRILRELRRAARKTELATGLSAAQTFVLNAVSRAPGCSLNDVAAMTLTDRTSVAAIVERLVDDEYLKRTQADEDRRRASLTITARGQRAIRDAAPPPTQLLVTALRALSSVERATLSRGLSLLATKMGIADEPAGMLFEDDRSSRLAKKGR